MTGKTKKVLLTGASGYIGQHFLYQSMTRDSAALLALEQGTSLHVHTLYEKSEVFPKAINELHGKSAHQQNPDRANQTNVPTAFFSNSRRSTVA
eukprot:scaffold39187_cov168-Amphora_coffeaeformis.AAC.4